MPILSTWPNGVEVLSRGRPDRGWGPFGQWLVSDRTLQGWPNMAAVHALGLRFIERDEAYRGVWCARPGVVPFIRAWLWLGHVLWLAWIRPCVWLWRHGVVAPPQDGVQRVHWWNTLNGFSLRPSVWSSRLDRHRG